MFVKLEGMGTEILTYLNNWPTIAGLRNVMNHVIKIADTGIRLRGFENETQTHC